MEKELKSLDEKLSQLIKHCHQLREDNRQLRQDSIVSLQTKKLLEEKLLLATTRLEFILQQLPDNVI